ncbi:AAA family ATPase [Sinorhizobium meliloti]|uniref:AAA family ATPase n=1 Tax=Rhizobium meliloti TaxID=382 RepID=UPI000B49D1B1|nr:AAA family ATPase [Sinorhizobium meliloti]ASP68625.1 ATP-dependent Zn protease [Sinorhizobium meliloti]MQX04581.1 AAA family ATPase [Sinorhizobium meliloti]RVK40138.1 AAA family ATPase [Sinorhizobium meliloti]
MKNISRDGHDFSLPEFLAYASISGAMRPFKRATRYAIGLIVPDWDRRVTYMRAALVIIDRELDFRFRDQVRAFDDEKAESSIESVLDMLQNTKTIILFKSAEAIPSDLRHSLDAIVQVPPPDSRLVRGVVRWAYGIGVTDQQAESLTNSNWKRLKLAMTRGRPISRVFAVLEKMAQEEPSAPRQKDPEALSDIRLEDMEGYGEAKEWGLELARDLADWRTGTISWEDVDKGVLLSGPPGTGKTMFARVLAASCQVKLIATSYAKWQAKGYLNDFLKAMQKSFKEARDAAPAILFVDEIDAFGSRDDAQGSNASYDIKAINGLLEQLDGIEGREGVIVVAACNHPKMVDAAILRAGRLDRHVVISLPDQHAREAIFRMHLHESLTDGDHHDFAAATAGLSGAEIQKIVRNARRSARRRREPITRGDVILHLPFMADIPPNILKANAVHEIGHAVVGAALGMDLVRVSIAGRIRVDASLQSLGQARFRRGTWIRRTKEHYLDLIAMTMAGMAAEEVFLGGHDDGVAGNDGSDLFEATKTAIALERSYGMGEKLASYGDLSRRRLEEIGHLDPELMARVDRILQEHLDRAKGILERHRSACIVLADELVARLELPGKEVLDALDGEDGARPRWWSA